jgi:tetratricopeptide (TPR) repeat protein
MAAKKISRKELLKGPDEFLTISSRAVIFFKDHSTQFSYLGVGIVVLICIYLGINTYMKYVNKKGQTAYNEAYYALTKNQNSDAAQEDLKQLVELFERVKKKYGLSKASRLALTELAHLKFREKKYDEAISLYKEFLAEVRDINPYEAMTLLALAACYEEKGDLKEAIEILKQIRANPDLFFEEQAMLSLSRTYRLSNQPEKSQAVLKEFVEKFNSSPFIAQVKAQLQEYDF